MNKISIIFFFVCLISCSNKFEYNGWTSHNLKGSVKEIQIKSFIIDTLTDKSIFKKKVGVFHQFKFSKLGDELIYNIYDENNNLKYVLTPKYENRRIIESTNNYVQKNYVERWVIKKYLLDYYGGEIECYVNNKLVKRVINSVNENGHQTKTKIMNLDNEIIFEKDFYYDNDENLIKIIENNEHTVQYKYLEFDKNKNWTKKLDSDGDKFYLTERQIIYY